MKTTITCAFLLVLLIYSCKCDDDVFEPIKDQQLEVIVEDISLEDQKLFGILSDKEGNVLGYEQLEINSITIIPYSVPEEGGIINFSYVYLDNASLSRSYYMKSIIDIQSDIIYLKDHIETPLSETRAIKVQLSEALLDKEEVIISFKSTTKRLTEFTNLNHIWVGIDANDLWLRVSYLEDEIWHYGKIPLAENQEEYMVTASDLDKQTPNMHLNSQSTGWSIKMSGIDEEGNVLKTSTLFRNIESIDTFFNSTYEIEKVDDLNIPAMPIEDFTRYISSVSVSNDKSLNGGMGIYKIGSPLTDLGNYGSFDYEWSQMSNGSFQISSSENGITYTETNWRKTMNLDNQAGEVYAVWIVYGDINVDIHQPELPDEIHSCLVEEIQDIELDFDGLSVVKDDRFINYQDFLDNLFYSDAEQYNLHWPFLNTGLEDDYEILIDYSFE